MFFPTQNCQCMLYQQDLERFFNTKSAGRIIEKGRFGDVLSDRERKLIITLAHEYLVEKCLKIERLYVVTVAKLLVFLMPKLKDDSTGEHAGYVS